MIGSILAKGALRAISSGIRSKAGPKRKPPYLAAQQSAMHFGVISLRVDRSRSAKEQQLVQAAEEPYETHHLTNRMTMSSGKKANAAP